MKPSHTNKSQYQPANYRVIPMFATPFLRGQLDLPSKKIISDIDNLIDDVKNRDNKEKLNDYTSYFDQDIRESTHTLPWFNTFSNVMKDTYIEFIRTQYHRNINHLSRDDIHLFAWINRYESEHQHDIHNHVDSYVSGTYYVNDSDRPIKFWNPNMAAAYANNGKEDLIKFDELPNMSFTGTTGFQSDMMFEPSAGDFLLWPSYMMHSVPPFAGQESNPRYSISFNLKHREPITDNVTGDQLKYSDVFGE